MASKFFRRLRQAVRESEKQIQPFREKRSRFLRSFVGKNYSQEGYADKMPGNMLYMAVTIYSRLLTPKNVRCLATTPYPQLKATATDFSLALDHLAEEINLDGTFASWIKDALFGLSILKVGMVSKELEGADGFYHDAGQAYADPTSLDDWVHDITARRYEQVGFAGNRYRMSLDLVRDNPDFDKVTREKATSPDSHFHSEGNAGMRAEELSQGRKTFPDEYKDSVELLDLWLPAENRMVTMLYNGADDDVLLDVPWNGPECGPYHLLRYNEVPGNIMPMPLAAHMYDINELYNINMRKLGRQSQRQKTIGVAVGDEDDAKRYVEASDGQVINGDTANAVQEVRLGGVDQQNFAFTIQLRDLASYFAGNIDSLGGLGAQSDTLGQDRLVKSSGNQQLQEMADVTTSAISKVFESLGWYLWHDPQISIPFIKRHQETGIEIPVTWDATRQEGDFYQYNLSMAPYSLHSLSPAERKQVLDQNFMMMLQAAPMMMQQGIMPNIAKYLELSSKYNNLPELEEIVMFMQGNPNEKQPIQPPPTNSNIPGMNNVTERVTRPSSNRAGREHVLSNTLFGGNNASQEQNAATRY